MQSHCVRWISRLVKLFHHFCSIYGFGYSHLRNPIWIDVLSSTLSVSFHLSSTVMSVRFHLSSAIMSVCFHLSSTCPCAFICSLRVLWTKLLALLFSNVGSSVRLARWRNLLTRLVSRRGKEAHLKRHGELREGRGVFWAKSPEVEGGN